MRVKVKVKIKVKVKVRVRVIGLWTGWVRERWFERFISRC